MEKSEKEQEAAKLELFIKDIQRYRISKPNAHEILRKLSTFNHTFSNDFSLLADYYVPNSHPEIYITDGINDLETYANSKLKNKDDKYFYTGINNVSKGIEDLLFKLNEEKD